MKLVLLSISGLLLVGGLLKGGVSFEIAGAWLLLLLEIVSLFSLYREARLFRAGKWKRDDEKKNLAETVAEWIRGFIIIGGLIATVCQQNFGYVIWGGTIACYILAGMIVQFVGGQPLQMGYGGWRISRMRRRR